MSDRRVDEDWLTATEETIGSALVRLALVLPEGRHYVASLRKTVRCLLESVNVRGEDIEDVELAIGELAANAMMHGGAPFTLGINYHTDRIILIMADRGRGLVTAGESAPDFLTRMPSASDLAQQLQTPSLSGPGADPASSTDGTNERFGGWGLPVVHRITDRVEVLPRQPHGTLIRAEKRLRPAPFLL